MTVSIFSISVYWQEKSDELISVSMSANNSGFKQNCVAVVLSTAKVHQSQKVKMIMNRNKAGCQSLAFQVECKALVGKKQTAGEKCVKQMGEQVRRVILQNTTVRMLKIIL